MCFLARLEGFEPPTYGLEVRCSIHLSYRRGLYLLALGEKSLTSIPGFLQDPCYMLKVGMFIAPYLIAWRLYIEHLNPNLR